MPTIADGPMAWPTGPDAALARLAERFKDTDTDYHLHNLGDGFWTVVLTDYVEYTASSPAKAVDAALAARPKSRD